MLVSPNEDKSIALYPVPIKSKTPEASSTAAGPEADPASPVVVAEKYTK